MAEHDEQVALFEWAAFNAPTCPELAAMFAIPNGAFTFGKRDKNGNWYSNAARRLIKEGLKKGVPDILLAVPRGGYHGLFIEMKWGRNKMTPEQIWWSKLLQDNGYKFAVCYGWQEGSELIKAYLEEREA